MNDPNQKEEKRSAVVDGVCEAASGVLEIGGAILEGASNVIGGTAEVVGGAAGEAMSGCAGCIPVVLVAFALPACLIGGYFIF